MLISVHNQCGHAQCVEKTDTLGEILNKPEKLNLPYNSKKLTKIKQYF